MRSLPPGEGSQPCRYPLTPPSSQATARCDARGAVLTMSAELQEAEEQIDVHDLPNFRFEGATQFDVNQESTTLQDAGGNSLAAQDEEADFSAYEMPDVIRSFIVYFQKNLRDRNVYEVHSIYENSFNKLTDRYYKNSPWPPAEVISPLVDGDQQFLLLYKELYYRHVYAKLQPTLEQRFESWANYCDIFNLLLEGDEPLALDLPNQWLWDLIDEFIYQFQTYCQFRARVKSKTDDELKALRDSPQSWAVQKVVYYLHALAERAEINATLSGARASRVFPPPVRPRRPARPARAARCGSPLLSPTCRLPGACRRADIDKVRGLVVVQDGGVLLARRPAARALPARRLPPRAPVGELDRPREEGAVHARDGVPHLDFLLRRLRVLDGDRWPPDPRCAHSCASP